MKWLFEIIKKLYSHLPINVKQKLHSDFTKEKDKLFKKVITILIRLFADRILQWRGSATPRIRGHPALQPNPPLPLRRNPISAYLSGELSIRSSSFSLSKTKTSFYSAYSSFSSPSKTSKCTSLRIPCFLLPYFKYFHALLLNRLLPHNHAHLLNSNHTPELLTPQQPETSQLQRMRHSFQL
jgi:hypothetical protein